MKILLIGGVSKSLINFRKELIWEFINMGEEVWACAGEPKHEITKELISWGVNYIPISCERASISPLRDLKLLIQLHGIINEIKPDIVLTYTIKPIIWGNIASVFTRKCKVYSMIEGLGYTFMPIESLKQFISSIVAKVLYKVSLVKSKMVFFLNPDDLDLFVRRKIVSSKKTKLLNGIGIDINDFNYSKETKKSNSIRFLMIARLLKDKGIYEYINAAKTFINDNTIKFDLAGGLDPNPTAMKEKELLSLTQNGIINYLGVLDNVKKAYSDCDVYVLPSYREGTPRTVLEAMAIGRAIITTDAPGCKETINVKGCRMIGQLKIGKNGIIIPVKNVNALIEAIVFLSTNPQLVKEMGRESRKYAVERYDVKNVNRVILEKMGFLNEL
ncbi:glycosyltransferase family 4 protein [Chitinispirillales bacterium ANBcel5]|uniref:glycosyltransferase family 4 protein n=1 Tax=Cellulosispirillum alkaliphilum TaxID=3039283 RepID=UPI002A4E3DEA|nr:glycosyltransferase family 4 protein [Chitinispirillales bacterium ANBcel5]